MDEEEVWEPLADEEGACACKGYEEPMGPLCCMRGADDQRAGEKSSPGEE